MAEAQGARMECLTGTNFQATTYELPVMGSRLAAENLRAAIAFVAEKRMPDMFHMSADLVSTSGFQSAFNQGDRAELFQHAIMRHCRFADFAVGREHGHLHPVFRMTGYVAFDASGF